MQKINTQKNPLRRVKLYELDSNGTWLDKGTGHLSIVFKEKMQDLKFVVNNELNNKIILTAKIIIQDIYQKQQETLIVWNDPDSNQDIALSFQEPKGCEEIWQFLNALIEKNEPFDNDEYSLGEINFKNLPRIIEIINGVEMIEREKFVNSMISRNSHIKLFSLFDKCEETGKKDLEIFFIIFQKLILLNDIQLLDVLFSQDCILRLMACLEYDPQVSTEKRVSHRNILSKKTIFKEVIPLDNEELREKIHQTYRVQYLKDVVLARTIDDPTFQTLNSFIVFNQIEIINHLKTEADYLKSVFNKAKAIDTPKDDLFNILQFINELFSLSKTLQMNARNEFFDQLLSYGVFEVLIITIGKGDNNLLVKSLDIINITLTNDASFFRKYLVSQKYSNTLLMKIISSFNNESCIASLKGQIGSILRQLIEPELEFAYFNENFNNNNQTREEVIEIFYDKCFPEIIKPLTQNDIPLTNCLETKHYIIELLNFCVKHHHQKIKVILIEQNLPTKILSLLNQDQKYVQLSAIRFLRAFIGSKDAVLVKFSISHKLFHPLVEIFKRNINRYNLINSSILDIFHFIYKEKNTALILHLVENFRETFEKVDYIDLFKNFIKKYDNIKSQVDESQKTPLVESKVKRELEKDREESWFDDSDSDEGQVFSTENSKLKRYDSLTSLITQQFINETDKNNNNNNNNNNNSSNGSSNGSSSSNNKQLDLSSVFNLDSDQPPSDTVDTPKKTLNISLNSNHVNKSENKPQDESPKKHKLDESNSNEDNIQVKKTKISTNEENK